ncbi:hypothetical protein LAZ67_10000422 [Cordylochernes scorpioides]|uniref:Reverse transcriptase domain-containing protein n=1 Tax=Cordylochernes scorpioides TaxID=51811 RepID=A0ABY6KVR3_9ARAC|nr:hypothetical protein LAZ67_10000422 [Cordylochernes scorpioides]
MSSLPNIDIRPFRHHEDRFNRNTWFATIDGDSFTSLKTASTLENGLLRLHGNWTSLSWTEDFSPRRCGKCAGFHGTKVCQKEETLCLNCGASDHQSANCKEAPKCVNCTKANIANPALKLDTNHHSMAYKCQCYKNKRISSHDKKSLIFINPMVRSFCVHTSTHTSTIQILKEGRSTFITNCYVPPVDPTQEDSAFSTLLDDLEAACNKVTNRLNNSQFGFRWGKSCEEALRKVKDILHKSRLANNHSIVISMDIEGAFDNASWDIIRESLKEKEVPPYLRTMIHSYLCSRKVSSDTSPQSLIDPLQITRGCPQGSNSGPLFWILYMDPIFSILKDENVHTIAYADDLLLICTS